MKIEVDIENEPDQWLSRVKDGLMKNDKKNSQKWEQKKSWEQERKQEPNKTWREIKLSVKERKKVVRRKRLKENNYHCL